MRLRTFRSGSERNAIPRFFIPGSAALSVVALGACSASPIAPAAGEPFETVRPSIAAASPTDIFLPESRITAAPDVTVWETKTTNPGTVPDIGLTDWECVLMMPESPQPGPWQFAGVTELYTPILDIVADRTGHPRSSSTVYYYFTLRSDGE